MAKITNIDHLAIRVSDIEESKEFYSSVLGFIGFTLEEKFPGEAYGWKSEPTWFWIQQADNEGKRSPHKEGGIGFHHYAFELSSQADVDEVYQFLKEHEITIVDEPKEYPEYGEGYYAVFFRDPDGLKLECMYCPPGE